jgi:Fe2+ transport system protein FeoA
LINTNKQIPLVNLIQLCSGNSGKVIKVHGSHMMIAKLEAMGVLPGTIITKKSAILGKGPIILTRGSTQFAIGYEIAQKILVEPIKNESRNAS